MNNTNAFAWCFIVPMVAGVLIALIGVIVHNLGYGPLGQGVATSVGMVRRSAEGDEHEREFGEDLTPR